MKCKISVPVRPQGVSGICSVKVMSVLQGDANVLLPFLLFVCFLLFPSFLPVSAFATDFIYRDTRSVMIKKSKEMGTKWQVRPFKHKLEPGGPAVRAHLIGIFEMFPHLM